MVSQAGDYLTSIERCLDESIADRPDLVLYNAGMDPFESCITGGLAGITEEILRERERMVFGYYRAMGIPVAFALAGGYVGIGLSQKGLVDLHRVTIEAAVINKSSQPKYERNSTHTAREEAT